MSYRDPGHGSDDFGSTGVRPGLPAGGGPVEPTSRAADPVRASALPGPELPGPELPNLELSMELSGLGPPGADDPRTGDGPSGGYFDEASLADADATDFMPVAEMGVGTGWAERSDPRYGDRVEGWVRPQYQDDPEPVAGEYWTPVPAEYGWPVPVERLREVPLYPPPPGYDEPVTAESAPVAPVPQWPPAQPDDRIEQPRSWSDQPVDDFQEVLPDGLVPAMDPYVQHDEPGTYEIGQPVDDAIWTVPERPEVAKPDFTWSPDEDGRRPHVNPQRQRGPAYSGDDFSQAHPCPEPVRPRPRPRPRPSRPEPRSTVYVSRHAAEPSTRPSHPEPSWGEGPG